MKRSVLIIVMFMLWIAAFGLWTSAEGAVPHLINYQGKLTDTNSVPLEGAYGLTFRIYDAETAGNLLWEETQNGVVINKGLFGVLLGSVTPLNIPFDKQYYLEIKVGTEVMSPRQRITSAGYAIRAEKADFLTLPAQHGDILYFNGSDWVGLTAGESGQYLKSQGMGSSPIWSNTKTGNNLLDLGTWNYPFTNGTDRNFNTYETYSEQNTTYVEKNKVDLGAVYSCSGFGYKVSINVTGNALNGYVEFSVSPDNSNWTVIKEQAGMIDDVYSGTITNIYFPCRYFRIRVKGPNGSYAAVVKIFEISLY